MATDRKGLTITTGVDYLLVGTVRQVGGDESLLLSGADGQHAVRCVNTDMVTVDSTHVWVSDVAPTDLFAGRLWFDTDHKLLQLYDGTDWLSSSDHVLVEVENRTGSDMSVGDLVYVSGTHTSGKPLVSLADSDDATKMPAIGVLPRAIANGGTGYVAVSGTVTGLALDPLSGFAAGQALYVDTTPGDWTTTRPTAESTLVQKVALITRAHSEQGSVIVMGAGRTNDTPNDSYSGRYDTTAATSRALGDVSPLTCEVFYTARPDGDGYAENEETATPPAGARIVRRLYYSDKFNANPTTSGDWTAYTSQPADGTSFATAKASLLAGLNDTDATANTRGTLPVSLKMEYEAVVDRLLDDYPGAEAAYSVRLIDKDYSGPCMRVRNVSTQDWEDIGFDTDGNLDESAIETLCGTANGAVEIWYDQSGGGHHQVQNTTTLQPFIYLGGSPGQVLKENGKPVIIFTDGGQLQNVAYTGTGDKAVTVNLMATFGSASPTPGTTFAVVGPGGDYSTYSNFIIGTTSGGGAYYGFCTTAGTGTLSPNFTASFRVNQTLQSSPTRTSLYTAIDPQAVVTASWTATVAGPLRWYINYNYSFAGSLQVQEYVIYYSDKSSDQSNIEDAINDYFGAY